MFGVRAFLPPNLHQIVPQNPGQIEYIWSPSVCFKNAHHAPLLFSDRTIESSIGRFQAHDLQVSRKLLIRISVLLQNIPPFWKGGQQWQVRRQQNSRNVELIKFLPSSNTRPRYLIYEYRWRVSGGICQNTHLTFPDKTHTAALLEITLCSDCKSKQHLGAEKYLTEHCRRIDVE